MCNAMKSCCCCVSLEVGTQVISILSILSSVSELSYCAWSAQALPLAQVKQISVWVVLAVVALFEVFCSGMLAYGTFWKQPLRMLPWIVLSWVKGVILLWVAGVCSAMLALGGYEGPSEVVFVVVCTVYAVVLFYLALVVGARRGEISRESYEDYEARPRSDSTPKMVYVPVTSYKYQ